MATFPRWLSWVVLIGLGYILYVGNTREPGAPPPREQTAEETATTDTSPQEYKQLQALVDGERWKKALNPNYESVNDACAPLPRTEGAIESYAIVTTEGTGADSACGETIALRIARIGNDGKPNKPSDVTLTLGEQKGFDPVLLGMRQGEERLVLVNLPERIKSLPPLPVKTQLLLSVARVAPAPAN